MVGEEGREPVRGFTKRKIKADLQQVGMISEGHSYEACALYYQLAFPRLPIFSQDH